MISNQNFTRPINHGQQDTMKIFFYNNFRNVLIVTLCIFGSMRIQAQNNVPDNIERAALLALYNNTDGANWNLSNANKWTLTRIAAYPNPDSTLYGVEVNGNDITDISLGGLGLTGNVPSQLNDLIQLSTLSLRANSLSGSLPNLGALTNLSLLDLSANDFSGIFPTWIVNLIELETLNLSSDPNKPGKLAGTLPSQISQLVKLKSLYLSYNDFSAVGSIPASFSLLDNLETLELRSVSLNPSSVSTGLSGLIKLRNLSLSSNSSFHLPDGTFPDVLYDLPALQQLFLDVLDFSKLPARFDDLSALNYLSLGQNNYSDTSKLSVIVDSLSKLAMLRTLVLNNCSIVGLPENFSSLSKLEVLHLSGNLNLEPDQCESIGGLPKLSQLYMMSCNLSSLPETLSDIATLNYINLYNNKLNPIPDEIQEIPNLISLQIELNGITTLPSWLGAGYTKDMQELSLANNLLTVSSFPGNFYNLTELRVLNLRSNKLEGIFPSLFSNLKKIYYLDLSINKLISPLPDFDSLKLLQYLYINNNNFSGALPSAISSSTGVSKLDVNAGYNKFDSFTPFVNQPALTLSVNNNQLNFSDITLQTSSVSSFTYASQDSVDLVTLLPKFAPGDTLKFYASIDTSTTPPSKFQWFKKTGNSTTAVTPSALETGHTLIIPNAVPADSGAYFYKITNPSYPGLTLISRLQTIQALPCDSIKASLNFEIKKYVCAYVFTPSVQKCSAISYSWDFGDGNVSIEQKPLHAFNNSGTYAVSLTVNYRCGSCGSNSSTIEQNIVFDESEPIAFKDTVITVSTDVRNNVLSTSASTFSDSWPLQYVDQSINNINSYLNGSQGVWRNEAAHVYNIDRDQTSNLSIKEDGTFALETFNWEQADLEAIPKWIRTNTMTEYSPFSYELENKDVFGIYSAALYDYGGHLPSANGANMRNNEMAFTSFEFLDGNSTGNWVFGNKPLPSYYLYKVNRAINNTAIVEASVAQLSDVEKVDVSGRLFFGFSKKRTTNYLQNNDIVCKQAHPTRPDWSVIVLRKTLFDGGFWYGRLKVKNVVEPLIVPAIDDTFAHSGVSSLKSTTAQEQTFKQSLLRLDSGKSYVISAWVSVKNPHSVTPKLADNLGIEVIFKNAQGLEISSSSFEPSGKIIEGWQQVKGIFTCPANSAVMDITFKSGSTGQAWYDDLRLHPENGNMKGYVYDLKDYRLRAMLDEENFASFFYYDDEGNLYLTKKETENGIKTIAENISYKVER